MYMKRSHGWLDHQHLLGKTWVLRAWVGCWLNHVSIWSHDCCWTERAFQGRDVTLTSGNQDVVRMVWPEGKQPLAVTRIAQSPNPHCHLCLCPPPTGFSLAPVHSYYLFSLDKMQGFHLLRWNKVIKTQHKTIFLLMELFKLTHFSLSEFLKTQSKFGYSLLKFFSNSPQSSSNHLPWPHFVPAYIRHLTVNNFFPSSE